MKVHRLGNDYIHQSTMGKAEPVAIETKPAEVTKVAEEEKVVEEVKQYDNDPAAGTQEPEPVEQEPQADTQEPAKEEIPEKKKGKGKRSQE